LIYLETGAYEKAEMAFKQAIELEGDVPARYMALAKTEEKLGSPKRAIEALENAYELDPSISTLRQILAIYEKTGDTEAMAATTARIEERIAEDNAKKKRQARKVVTRSATRKVTVRPK
jgi:tetratricopeptide (TPR) repeat protein